MQPNPHAQALGRLNKGVKKTMTRKAMIQRKKAAKRKRKKRTVTILRNGNGGIISVQYH